MRFNSYDPGPFFDEIFEPSGRVRPEAESLVRMIDSLDEGDLRRRQHAAERALLYSGVRSTYTVTKAGERRFSRSTSSRAL